MKAIATVAGSKILRLVGRPEPSVSASDEIKLKILRVGICGTDRMERVQSFLRALNPGRLILRFTVSRPRGRLR